MIRRLSMLPITACHVVLLLLIVAIVFVLDTLACGPRRATKRARLMLCRMITAARGWK